MLDGETEDKIKKESLSYLKRGRPGWDIPHTLACVHWIKELIKVEGGNPKVLVPAMYFHDIGYIELMTESLDLRKNMDMKEEHMKRGAVIAKKILDKIGGFSREEIERICSLVSIHDIYEKINDFDSQLIYEADGLGQIDRERVKPTYSKDDAEIFLRDFQNKRGKRFKTNAGKRIYGELIIRAKEYAENH